MPRTVITPQTVDLGLSGSTYTGKVISTVAMDQANGMEVANDERTLLQVTNGDASGHTVTITRNKKCDEGHQHDPAFLVPNGVTHLFGPFDRAEFSDVLGNLLIDVDVDTSMTIAAISPETAAKAAGKS